MCKSMHKNTQKHDKFDVKTKKHIKHKMRISKKNAKCGKFEIKCAKFAKIQDSKSANKSGIGKDKESLI